jgi:hypothetical protein
MLSNKLTDYFKDNINVSLRINEKIFIVSKKDIFYEINIYDENIALYVKNNDTSIIESMKVDELCYKNIIEITQGYNHYIARTYGNDIYCWGNNYFGQLGSGKEDKDTKNYNKPFLNTLLTELEIEIIKCGAFHSIALTKNGDIYVWGNNGNGEIGSGRNIDYHLMPIKVSVDNERIISVSCGFQHSLALTVSYRVFGWGDNSCGQLGYDEEEYSNVPKLVESCNVLIKKISCGPFHSLLLSEDGVIFALGKFFQSRMDKKSRKKTSEPFILSNEQKFIEIASHWDQDISIGLSIDNFYYVWKNCKEDKSLAPDRTIYNSSNEKIEQFFGNKLGSIYYFDRYPEKEHKYIRSLLWAISSVNDNNFDKCASNYEVLSECLKEHLTFIEIDAKNIEKDKLIKLSDLYKNVFNNSLEGKLFLQNGRFKYEFDITDEDDALIGEGGFSCVYKGKHNLDYREYAIKKQLLTDDKIIGFLFYIF